MIAWQTSARATLVVREDGPPRAKPDPRDVPRSGFARFPLGHVYATPGALRALAAAESRQDRDIRHAHAGTVAPDTLVASLLARHVSGDWGELNLERSLANESAIRNGERILSVYRLRTGERVWIITEADRSATTLLLPSDY